MRNLTTSTFSKLISQLQFFTTHSLQRFYLIPASRHSVEWASGLFVYRSISTVQKFVQKNVVGPSPFHLFFVRWAVPFLPLFFLVMTLVEGPSRDFGPYLPSFTSRVRLKGLRSLFVRGFVATPSPCYDYEGLRSPSSFFLTRIPLVFLLRPNFFVFLSFSIFIFFPCRPFYIHHLGFHAKPGNDFFSSLITLSVRTRHRDAHPPNVTKCWWM